MGNVLQGGEGQAPARQAVLGAGTGNCSSSTLKVFGAARWWPCPLKRDVRCVIERGFIWARAMPLGVRS